jgi:hypothetical protein
VLGALAPVNFGVAADIQQGYILIIYYTRKSATDHLCAGRTRRSRRVGVLACDHLNEGCGLYNGDFPEGIERQQVLVTGNDEVSVAIQGKLQELIIFGVAAFSNSFSDRYPFCRGQ